RPNCGAVNSISSRILAYLPHRNICDGIVLLCIKCMSGMRYFLCTGLAMRHIFPVENNDRNHCRSGGTEDGKSDCHDEQTGFHLQGLAEVPRDLQRVDAAFEP